MDCVHQIYQVLVGAGGENPGIEIFGTGAQNPSESLAFPYRNSVYAIDINIEDKLFAIGTKGGLIYILKSFQENHDLEVSATRRQKLSQGAPVLSVCWINRDLISAGDTAGRCLLWYFNTQKPPIPLETVNGAICGLINLKDKLLVGLSSTGTLHFWDVLNGQLARTVNVPAPPKMSGLVRLTYWPADGTLVFPAQKGFLTLYNCFSDSMDTLKAHRGDVYAISVKGENLVTAGMNDDQIKIWSSGSKEPATQIQAFKGIISMAVTSINQSKVLLVESGGTAGVFGIVQNRLKPLNRFSGKDYRVVFGPSPESIKALYEQQRLAEVHQITNQLLENGNQAPPEVIKDYYARLDKLGFGHIPLAHQADQAIEKKNIAEALRIRHLLQNKLPDNDPKALPSMEKYADLLVRAWHLREACEVCQKILSIDPQYCLDTKLHDLGKIADIIRVEDSWIIEPDIKIDQIIQSAGVIGKSFSGRYVIKKHHPMQWKHTMISTDEIVTKYEKILKDLKNSAMPAVMKETIWLFSQSGFEKINLITFGKGNNNSIKGLQFALEVIKSDLAFVAVPWILFDWRDMRPGRVEEDHNENALKYLTDIITKVSSRSYLSMIQKTLMQTLSKLISENTLRKGFN